MLVASGPIAGDKPWGQPVAIVTSVVPVGLSAPFGHPDRPLPPGSIEAGDGSRQAVGRAASSLSVRLAVPIASLLPSAVGPLRDASLACPPERSSALPKQGIVTFHRRRGDPISDCAPLAASAVRQADPRGIFEACFPTLLRASLPCLLG